MKRIISLFLTVIMAMSLLPATAFAYEGTVADIEFSHKEDIVLYYETEGQWWDDNEGGQFFHYNGVCFKETGDTLTIIDNEGGRYTYTAEYNEEERKWNLVSEDGDIIDYNEVDMIDEQEHNHFTVGNDNYVYVEYKGIRKPIQVTVIENPVVSIEYTPVNPIVVYENIHGHWETDSNGDEYFNYDIPDFKYGDILSVTYSGELETIDYTYKEVDDNWDFYDDNDEIIPNADDISRWKHGETWSIGDNTYYVNYSGRDAAVNVTIVSNPVKGIDYTRKEADEYFEGDTWYDNWDDAYYYHHPYFKEGDILTVIEDEPKQYVCKMDNNTYEYYFESDDGEKIEGRDVDFYDSQNQNPWIVGNSNEFYVNYMGFTKTLYATVKVNPVKSIEYVRSEPPVVYEKSEGWEYDGNWFYDEPRFMNGDSIIVTDNNNAKKTYTFSYYEQSDDYVFKADDGEILEDVRRWSNQDETPWKVGSDNEYYIEYMHKRTQPINVTIIKNTIKEIRIEKAKPVVVYAGDGHEEYNPWDNHKYIVYNIPFFEDGDKLIVIDEDNSSKEYTFAFDENDGEYYFFCGHERIQRNELDARSEQYVFPWEVNGSYNYYTVEFRGKSCTVPVTVLDSDVKSIVYTPYNPERLVADECDEAAGEWLDEGKVFYYHLPLWDEKDTLVVTYTNDSTDIFTVKRDENGFYIENAKGERIDKQDIDIYDCQHDKAWTPGKNVYYVKYKGVTCKVPVTINHVYEEKVVSPTCTDKGYTKHICKACKETYNDNYTNATGHKWDAGKVTKAATYTATGVKTFTCTNCGKTRTEIIAKLAKKNNPITIKGKTVKIKLKAIKKKKQIIAVSKAFTIKNAQGTLSFKKIKGDKKITINKKTGKITVKKGLKKGIYKVQVKINNSGNSTYKSAEKTVTIKIKVK